MWPCGVVVVVWCCSGGVCCAMVVWCCSGCVVCGVWWLCGVVVVVWFCGCSGVVMVVRVVLVVL